MIGRTSALVKDHWAGQARLLLPPSLLCAFSLAAALAMAVAADMAGTDLLWGYLALGFWLTPIIILFWLFLPFLRAGKDRGRSPFEAARTLFLERGPLAILPFFILPVFLTAFTVAKSSFPFLTGYHWDGIWTAADHLVFGTDPWRLTHAAIGQAGSEVLTFFYTVGWALALAFGLPLYALNASVEQAVRAYLAMMLTWLSAGVLGAVLFSSVGPIFAELVDPELGARFAPLKASLATVLAPDNMILISQDYLRSSFQHHVIVHAGGVSAMPSMHLGVSTILVIIAGRSVLRVPAIALWATIWVGSIHFGYHYALDGLVGSGIAWLCWKVTAPRARAATVRPTEDIRAGSWRPA